KLKNTPHQKIAVNLYLLFFPTRAVTHRLRERLLGKRSFKNYLYLLFNCTLGKTLGKLRFFRTLIRKIDYFTFSVPNEIQKYFDEFKPSSIIVSDVFYEIDSLFQIAAKKNRTKQISIVRSWDNTTNKGLLRQIPDYLIVNNDNIGKEAINLHDASEKTIFVGGFPQFDMAFRRLPQNRIDFFKSINLDPKKKLLIFCPAGQQISDTDWQICEILKIGQQQGKITKNLQFLVRSHPLDPARLEKFSPNDSFSIECPGIKFKDRDKVTELKKADQEHLMDSLFHCDILLNITSTISLDCLPFNKPQILISFDGWEKLNFIKSIRHFQTDEHFATLVQSGAITVANNPDELYKAIELYIENPMFNVENRSKALSYQIGNTDGNAGSRFGAEVARLIKQNVHHR
ncbi:MAG: CDP-glycerol glycerophosphotransferase family protein, partial [Pseudobdellovibrionaceae bacterium]